MYVCMVEHMYVCGGVCMCVGCGDVCIYEAANKSCLYPKFFSSENDSERNSKVFSLPKMVRNGILRFFSSAKQAEFRRNYRLFRLVPNSAE